MSDEYIPNPSERVAKQVELYESTDGREGSLMLGLPCVVVTYRGKQSGAVRKTPLMRVADGDTYLLVASMGGAPKHPVWYHNLVADPHVTIRDGSKVQEMNARLVTDPAERARLWPIAVAAFPNYAEYEKKTTRVIPVFVAEPV